MPAARTSAVWLRQVSWSLVPWEVSKSAAEVCMRGEPSCVISAEARHADAGDGYVVVGSEDGKVRLYSSNTLTMAKTAIPGLGAPITSVDVTYDGKWVLATTDKYVMVVKTMFRDKNGRYALSQCNMLQSK